MNIIGNQYRITLIGSSHGNLVGVVIDGVPPNYEIDIKRIHEQLKLRRPGQSKVSTERDEKDLLIIETGLLNGKTTGEPIVAFVRNKDTDSTYYDEIKDTPRPGHADYPAFVKYKGANDYRGGGRFSGRLTVGIVIAGAIARQILDTIGVQIVSFTKSIADIKVDEESIALDNELIYNQQNIVRTADANVIIPMVEAIENAKNDGDSVGGIIETRVLNVPVGVGEPWFDSIESSLAHFLFSIPAVKGIEFGSGFNAAKMRGSKHNDQYSIKDGEIVTTTNNAGGILGGLSTGMPIIFRVGFKPTSSISKEQNTIDRTTLQKEKLVVKGRHDPCIVPRAVPVVNNATACVLLDLMLSGSYLKQV